MRAKLGHSPLTITSLGSDHDADGCLSISGGDHLLSLANRHFDEGNQEEASRLLREALRGVSLYLAEGEGMDGARAVDRSTARWTAGGETA